MNTSNRHIIIRLESQTIQTPNIWKQEGCLLGLDLQGAIGVKTTKSRLQELLEVEENDMAETCTHWTNFYSIKYKNNFTRLGTSKNHRGHTVFKQPQTPIQKRIGESLFTFKRKLERKSNVWSEKANNQIEQLYQRNFVAPVVNKAKKDGSVKIAMDAKPIKAQILKNQYQMPNLLEQLDVAAQTINSNLPGEVLFTSLDLKYAFS